MVKNTLLLLVVAALLPSSAAIADDGVSLQWKFPVGRKVKIEMTQEMKTAQDVGGQEIKTDMTTTSYMTWSVDEVDQAGVAKIDSTIDRMKMNMNGPQGEIVIDTSSKEELTGMAKIIGGGVVGIVDKPFSQTMDTRGQVITVDFPQEFDDVNMVMGKGVMEKLVRDASPGFPDRPIAIGDTWNQDATTNMPGGMGAMRLKSIYTYMGAESVDGEMLDVIDIAMQVEFVADEESPAVIEITDQNTSGKIYFDSANGHISKMIVDQKMEMDIAMGAQNIKQKIENKTEGTFTVEN